MSAVPEVEAYPIIDNADRNPARTHPEWVSLEARYCERRARKAEQLGNSAGADRLRARAAALRGLVP